MIEDLRRILESGNAVVLDTETTGLGEDAEVIEIAITDTNGNSLFDSFIKPLKPIPSAATAVHGITNEMVRTAPTWRGAYPRIARLMQGKTVLVYNVKYDKRIIEQTDGMWRLGNVSCNWYCIMEHHKAHYRLNRWQKLSNAAEIAGVPLPSDNLHRAMTDTLLALAVARKMAGL